MTAQELRIGNVILIGGKERYVTSRIIADIDSRPGEDWFKPIELSPEVLERCGFRVEGAEWVHESSERFDFIGTDFYYYPYEGGYIGKAIPFLHDLQNFMHAVFGTELNYKP